MKMQLARLGSPLLVFLSLSTPLLAQQSYSHVRTGTLTRVATVDPMHTPAIQSLARPALASTRPKGARMLHSKNPAPGAAAKISGALAQGQSGLEQQSVPSLVDFGHSNVLLSNFDGVSSLDSAVTNFGLEFEPPDQGLCVGNGFVVEPVNSAFTIYRRDGTVVAGPFNVNVLYDEGLTQFTSDPRCHFDKTTNTWFATILFISADNTEAHTDIAVNASGDPTTPWTVFRLEATDDGTDGTPVHVGCPCFGDQPRLGIDRHNIYISTDEFSILGPQFNGGQLYALSKRDLINGATTVPFVHYENLTVAGVLTLAIEPAITNPGGDGEAEAEFFLESLDPTFTFDNRLVVWALTDPDDVSKGGIPRLSSIVINSEVFGVPPNAPQASSISLLNTGDDRMQQAQFINGNLWGELNTAFTLPGSSTQLTANAWFKIRPRVHGGQIVDAEIVRQGYLSSPENFLFYPALQVSPNGKAAMVFTISSPNLFASVAYSRMSEGERSFGPIKIAALGSGPYDPNATRWGDYSWAVVDPDGHSIWLATEYIPPPDRQTVDGLRNWGTRVLEVSVDNDDED